MGKPLHYDVHGQLCLLAMDDDQINLMVVEQLLAPQGWRVRPVRWRTLALPGLAHCVLSTPCSSLVISAQIAMPLQEDCVSQHTIRAS